MSVDADRELAGLKDFQRNSAEYVFDRLYGAEPTHRFLIADEVGLGKTLVARGVIARAIEYLAPTTKRIDILYVCSNLEIAQQNIRRLNVLGDENVATTGRVTLLPIQHYQLDKHPINFIALTPGTSLDSKGGMGTSQERAVLRMMLRAVWGSARFGGTGSIRVFQKPVRTFDKFRREALGVQDQHARRLDQGLVDRFRDAISEEDVRREALDQMALLDEFTELCGLLAREPKTEPKETIRRRRAFVATTRRLLAKACIRLLQPDLIILDEFQRFRHLIDPSDDPTPENELAHELFNYTDETSGEAARLLLLSATPYKMLTLHGDVEDDHYADFTRTVGFLLGDSSRTAEFERALAQFRVGLLQADVDNGAAALQAKTEIEAVLRRVMVRTERLVVTADRDGMLTERNLPHTALTPEDVHAYAAAAQISRSVDSWDPLEVWKAAPYLFSFLDGYQLGTNVSAALDDPVRAHAIGTDLSRGGLVDHAAVEAFSPIDPANARLRGLIADTIDEEMWRLLWVPPSLPYHQPTGVWKVAAEHSLTKRLVFSAWQIVPKSIAAVMSYDAERRMMTERGAPRHPNTAAGRARFANLLAFRYEAARSRLAGMPHFALVHPSPELSRIGDPRVIARRWLREQGRLPTVDEVLADTTARIGERLAALDVEPELTGPADERWYWAASLQLDWEADRATEDAHWNTARPHDWNVGVEQPEVAADAAEAGDSSGDRFADHFDQAQSWYFDPDGSQLGPPPDDLAEVLAHLALGGFGNCAYRAIARSLTVPERAADDGVRRAAARGAWGLRSLFNSIEVTELIRQRDDAAPYWRQVLKYCVEGNLQAVLDEHCHATAAVSNLAARPIGKAAAELGSLIHETSTLRSVAVALSDIAVEDGVAVRSGERHSMRHNFAQRLGADRTDTDADGKKVATRSKSVRDAFNSPFWPWVLASTSIGQEGLDFHVWCHAVVHWNLPSNPVDMEQREGRVNRYLGHAVRKNVAADFGEAALASDVDDPWVAMFNAASDARRPGENDLVPYWIYPTSGEPAARIERVIPMLPLSRDARRLHDLRRTLAAYRLAFGQPRQTELLEYLTNLDPEHLEALVDKLKIDLRPPAHLQ